MKETRRNDWLTDWLIVMGSHIKKVNTPFSRGTPGVIYHLAGPSCLLCWTRTCKMDLSFESGFFLVPWQYWSRRMKRKMKCLFFCPGFSFFFLLGSFLLFFFFLNALWVAPRPCRGVYSVGYSGSGWRGRGLWGVWVWFHSAHTPMHRHPRLEEFIWWTPLEFLFLCCLPPILVVRAMREMRWERWSRDKDRIHDTDTETDTLRDKEKDRGKDTERETGDYGGDWSTPAPAPAPWNCCPVHITIAELITSLHKGRKRPPNKP